MKNKNLIISIALLLVGLGAGFFGGMQYRSIQLKNTRGNFAGSGGGNFQRYVGSGNPQGTGVATRGMITAGSIVSVDSASITVKLADGSSKIIILSGSTTYSNTVSASASDLKTGENVAITGTTNSDGSVTATNVQINPALLGREPLPSPTP
jgi:hypothetical protein